MLLVAIHRSILFALQSFWRNFWLSIATIFIIFLALISINFLIVINAVSNSAVQVVKDKIDISVYFKQDIRESKIAEVKSHLETLSQIKSIVYHSSDENLDDFKNRHKNDPVISETLKELPGNPLGATLIIKARQLTDYPEILAAINNPAYDGLIEEKNYDDHQLVIQRINGISDNIKKGGLVVSLIFVIIAVLIVFNTVRIAIFTHQNEISIMKLVGASNWFIRAPFILESIFSGIIACVLALLVIYPFLSIIQPKLSSFFDGATFDLVGYFNIHILLIVAAQLGGIIILNVISSSLAIGKYLKV